MSTGQDSPPERLRQRPSSYLRQLPPAGSPERRQPRYSISATQVLLLGRDPACDIVIESLRYRAVSRRHAEIRPMVGIATPDGTPSWQVCDLNSANGTYVNGKRVEGCQILQVGDRLVLGRAGPEFLFEDGSEDGNPRYPPGEGVNLPAIPDLPVPRQRRSHASQPYALQPERDGVSLTQLFPIFSTGRDLTRKAYLLPGGITVTFVVLMFLAVGEPLLFNLLLAAYLSGAAFYFIYQLCGKHKPLWVLILAAAITIAILLSPLLDWFVLVFRTLLPGHIPANETSISFPVLLVKMFFGAGLMEELIKSIPVLLLWWVGRQGRRSRWREAIGVWEPLDGILLGAASAVGFTLVETLGQYLPDVYRATMGAGEGAAQLASLQLLIPRVLGSVAGHIAYSGYLGYFIGLSVMRRRKRWLVLGVGYLTAAGLHALWNTAGSVSPVLLAVVGVLSYAFLGAAILKARELSPTRSQNFATRFYR